LRPASASASCTLNTCISRRAGSCSTSPTSRSRWSWRCTSWGWSTIRPNDTGDLLTLAATILFATHITLLSIFARRHDVRRMAVLQIVAAAAIFALLWGAFQGATKIFGLAALPAFAARETVSLAWGAGVAWQLLYLAVVGTVVAFLLWTWGQSRTTPTRAAIIFSLEPVFATAFAVAVLGPGEWLGPRGFAGAGLVFAGIIVSEMRLSPQSEAQCSESEV